MPKAPFFSLQALNRRVDMTFAGFYTPYALERITEGSEP
jgi:hypothetical protein